MGETSCNKCVSYRQNKKPVKNEWEGKCLLRQIERNGESSSCSSLVYIEEYVKIEPHREVLGFE